MVYVYLNKVVIQKKKRGGRGSAGRGGGGGNPQSLGENICKTCILRKTCNQNK